MEYFHNKKILITQNALHLLAGSEITTLELATFFQQNGADVLVFTWYLDSPMSDEFIKRNIPVTTDEEDKRFDNVDIVWVHHQVIPEKILATLKTKNHPQFFFFHMSPLTYIPLEHPYLNNLESKIANKVLFSSEGTEESLLDFFPSLTPKSAVLENLLPDSFCDHNHNTSTLQKILIVSNHPPEELIEAANLLEKKHLKVDFIGQTGKAKLVTTAILKQYDLIISIGKTVVYCLGTNTPVYVYDHFGGPGFLSEKNFKKAQYRTFSGRNFHKKTSKQIVSEIINDYQKCIDYQAKHLKEFREEFSIKKQFNKLFKDIKNTTSSPITKEEYNSLKAILQLVKAKIIAENVLWSTTKNNNNATKKLQKLETEHRKLLDEHAVLVEKYTLLLEQHNAIVDSKKYRLLSKASKIIHLGH